MRAGAGDGCCCCCCCNGAGGCIFWVQAYAASAVRFPALVRQGCLQVGVCSAK
jgi:hypothetical protein